MNFTIHRGTHEIGGSCIEVRHADTRLIMDIGMPLVAPGGERFDMKTYKGLSDQDLVKEGILPNLSGCYRWDTENRPVDGVLISHAHFDHYGFASYLRDDTHYYLGDGTRALMEILAIYSGHDCKVEKYSTIKSGKLFQVGSISVTPYLMDHSAFDAYAFLLEAGGKRLLYTGDFRAHGRKAYALPSLLKGVPKGIDDLLLEGTLIGREGDPKSEEEIEAEYYDLFKTTEHLVMVAASGQNIDRLVSIYKAAKRANRLFVIDPYIANVLEQLSKLASLPHPSPGFENIKVYFPSSITERLKRIGRTEDFTKYGKDKIDYKGISGNLSRTVMLIRPTVLDYLKKIGGIDGATVVWSQWSGYLKEDYNKVFQEFVHERGMKLVSIHTSGHASMETMKNLVNELQPKRIIPVHTNKPEEFQDLFRGFLVEIAEDGVPMR
jgi:ribonuclease J